METSFSGELSIFVKDEVHLFEVNEGFEVLDFAEDLKEIDDDFAAELSTDQQNLYNIVKMITTGNINHNYFKHIIGPVNHARWLTTACRLCRLWVSKHGLRKHSKVYKSLKVIVSFIVAVYTPMWFEIMSKHNILHGPHHVQLFSW